MAENPLLPDAELRALHTLLKQATHLGKAGRRGSSGHQQFVSPEAIGNPEPAALLAGTLLQLAAGDTLVARTDAVLPLALLAKRANFDPHSLSVLRTGTGQARLLAAAALAEAYRRQKADRLVLALVHAGEDQPDWVPALQWAQAEQLPLIVACADPSGEAAFRLDPARPGQSLTWTNLRNPAAKMKLPVLTVDGEDAVAVYRVMQESVLRARSGGGPAVLWAALPAPSREAVARPRNEAPLARLAHFLRSRNIPLRTPGQQTK